MGEYFRGWKRKLGLLVLVMALVFMASWVRSQSVGDLFTFVTTTPDVIYCTSGHGFIQVELHRYGFAARNWFARQRTQWASSSLVGDGLDQSQGPLILKYSSSNPDDILAGSTLIVPYRTIVLPLTAISAWLLLSKPRTTATQ